MRRLTFILAGLLVAACAQSPGPSITASSPTVTTPVGTTTPEPTTAPTLPPPAGRIALVRGDHENTDVFVVDADGSNAVRLTNGAGSEQGLIWSPDGTRLFFESQTLDTCGDTYCFVSRLLSVGADGRDPRDLGPIGQRPNEVAPVGVLSPDGRRAAYGDDLATERIVIADVTTATARRLATSAPDPIWSPDGTRLLVYALADGGSVSVLDASTGAVIFHRKDPWTMGIVGWSADGSSVSYKRCDAESGKVDVVACLAGPPWILRVDVAGATPAQSDQPLPKGETVRSPDGTLVASMQSDGLYVGPRSGSLTRIVTMETAWPPNLASWSPDGQWLAFEVSDGSLENRSVYVVSRRGGAPVLVGDGYGPAWQPTASPTTGAPVGSRGP